MLNATVGISAFLLVLGLLCVVVQLIAGVIGIKSCADPTKFSKLFGLTIAGIVVSALTCRRHNARAVHHRGGVREQDEEAAARGLHAAADGYAGAQPYANQGAYQAPQPGYYQQPYVQPGQNPYAQGTPQQPYGQPYEQPYAQGAPQPPFAQQQDAQSQPLNEQQPPQDPTQNNQ